MKKYTREDWSIDGNFSAEIGQEIEEEIYWQMYDCLPPFSLTGGTPLNRKLGIVAGFRVGEPYIHDEYCNGKEYGAFYSAFGKTADGKFYFLGEQNKYGDVYDIRARKAVENDVVAFRVGIKEYILKWLEESNYLDEFGTLNGKSAYDVGYDMKSDFEDCEYNPVQKINEEWEQEYDEVFDEMLEENIIPILVELGAVAE